MGVDLIDVKNQAVKMTGVLLKTSSFIVYARLWDGFFRQRLVIMVSLLAAIIIPYSVFELVKSKISYAGAADSSGQALASMHNAVSWSSLFDGTNKYLVLILIQMLVVYFSNRTIEYLSGVRISMTVHELFSSQIRVIVVSVRNWVIELGIGVVIAIIIGIFGPSWLEDVMKFIVGCFFVGYLFIDNYNFTFGLTVKDSFTIVKKHSGAALIVGFVAKILLLLPVIGSLFVSVICSVAATWYMHTSEDKHAGIEAFPE
mgnify:CR=1 FL=1